MKARPPIKSEQRQDGVYRTPWLTAKYMVSRILPYVDSSSRILDPAAGDGVFVRALIDSGLKPEQITAQDINPEKLAPLKGLGVETRIADTLLDPCEKFDAIIGNPPYKSRRQSNYMKVNKTELEKKYGFIGLYNLYTLFTVSVIEHVNENGIICFILQDPFMTNRYYRKFRDYLLNMVSIQEITLAPWRLFHQSGADVRTAIIILQKTSGPAKYEERMSNLVRMIDRLPDEESYRNPPKEQSVPQAEFHRMPDRKFFVGIPMELIRLVQNPPQRFGYVSEGGTGISTGNDAKYLRRREEVTNNPQWVGFYKSGKRRPYYYETPFYIEKEFEKNERSSNDFIVRNRKYFFREGITCSSVGRRFSAAYL
ncbi:MAG: Eco57I restriction-modification methylase domain-containing protein, partial [Candidatus Hodarchaeales archaeon]